MPTRLLIYPFLLIISRLSAQDFDAACTQQRQVYERINVYHFSPPPFSAKTNLEILDLFIKEADERNFIFLKTDRLELQHTVDLSATPEVYCNLVKHAYTIMKNRLRHIDTLLARIERQPLEIDGTDTITFMANVKERILCASGGDQEKRIIKRIRFESLSDICTPRKDLPDPPDLSLDELRMMTEAAKHKSLKRLRLFLEEFKNDDQLLHHVSDCMSNAIATRCDPHTNFFNMSQLENYQNALSMDELSFGFNAGEDEAGHIIITSLVPGGPAWKSDNLNEKDVIMSYKFENEKEVELYETDLQDFNEAFYKNGAKTVELKVMKKDFKIKTVKLKKEKIQSQENMLNSYLVSVNSTRMGYIPIPSFYLDQETDSRQGCANDVAREILELKDDSIQGLILDLRYNGGGSMREAIGLAGIFIDEGPVAIYKARTGNPFLLKDINRGSIWTGPLVILVNSASASASEFVTATLQDYNRAIIAGSTTFGKGTAQSLILFDSAYLNRRGASGNEYGYMKITGGKFYRLSTESHQGKGIAPDIYIPGLIEKVMEKESGYPYYLPCDSVNKKVSFARLGELPKGEIRRMSNVRTGSSLKFTQINRLGDSLQLAKKNAEKVPLNLTGVKNYTNRQKAFNAQIESTFSDTASDIRIFNNTQNQKLIVLSDFQKKNNENALEGLRKDIILHECIYILNDLISLSRK
jgi:carboxyl-terminal processing protease